MTNCGHEDVQRDVLGLVERLYLSQVHKEHQVLLPRLRQHKRLHRRGGAVQGLALRDRAVEVGLERFILDRVENGVHDKQRQEQREADDDLRRRRLLRADGGAEDAEDDHQPREARHQHDDGRGQREAP